jgi:hypothetical protein
MKHFSLLAGAALLVMSVSSTAETAVITQQYTIVSSYWEDMKDYTVEGSLWQETTRKYTRSSHSVQGKLVETYYNARYGYSESTTYWTSDPITSWLSQSCHLTLSDKYWLTSLKLEAYASQEGLARQMVDVYPLLNCYQTAGGFTQEQWVWCDEKWNYWEHTVPLGAWWYFWNIP